MLDTRTQEDVIQRPAPKQSRARINQVLHFQFRGKAMADAEAMKASMDRLVPGALQTADQALRPASHPANQLYQQTMRMTRPRAITAVDDEL